MNKFSAFIASLIFASATFEASGAEFSSLAYVPQVSRSMPALVSTADIVGPAVTLTEQLRSMQAGPGNLGLVWQNGNHNEGLIHQRGSGNIALIAQIGIGNIASIRQTGNNHRAMAFQQGRNNVAIIRQR